MIQENLPSLSLILAHNQKGVCHISFLMDFNWETCMRDTGELGSYNGEDRETVPLIPFKIVVWWPTFDTHGLKCNSNMTLTWLQKCKYLFKFEKLFCFYQDLHRRLTVLVWKCLSTGNGVAPVVRLVPSPGLSQLAWTCTSEGKAHFYCKIVLVADY